MRLEFSGSSPFALFLVECSRTGVVPHIQCSPDGVTAAYMDSTSVVAMEVFFSSQSFMLFVNPAFDLLSLDVVRLPLTVRHSDTVTLDVLETELVLTIEQMRLTVERSLPAESTFRQLPLDWHTEDIKLPMDEFRHTLESLLIFSDTGPISLYAQQVLFESVGDAGTARVWFTQPVQESIAPIYLSWRYLQDALRPFKLFPTVHVRLADNKPVVVEAIDAHTVARVFIAPIQC